MASPTVRRRRLAQELRRRRDAKGLTVEQAALKIEMSKSTLSRIETGRVRVRARDVRLLMGLYGATADETERYVELSREARQPGWWHQFGDLVSDWFEMYVGLESEVASMRTYQSHVIPGLLQTPEYAHALFAAEAIAGDPPDEVEPRVARRVELRMGRQLILTRDKPARLWFVLDEAALHRWVGGAEVMRAQLHHLSKIGSLSHVSLQVLPNRAGAYPGMGAPFSILTFPDEADTDVVYVESQVSALYMDKKEQVERYTLVFDHLRAAALSPSDSADEIAKAAAKFS